jgi:large conductance mechanosensitive channel
MKILREFRDFAMRGNVVDLAVAVIIGAAFGRIVTSLVEDILMPPIGKLIGNMDFTNLYYPLYNLPQGTAQYPKTLVEAKKLGSVIAYGNFITLAINFLIIAFCIFMIVKMMTVAKKRFEKEKPAEAPGPPSPQEVLLTDIRDILRAQSNTAVVQQRSA